MNLVTYDLERVVDAKLVQRNTFLAFEPAVDAKGDAFNSRRKRSYSDPLVGHCSCDDTEFRFGSMSNSDTMSIASSQLHRVGDDSSLDAESETEADIQQDQACAVTTDLHPQQEFWSASSQPPRVEQMFYYYAMPGTQLWNQFNAARGASGGAQTNMSLAMKALQSAELEARAAELQLQAARLKAAARQVEAQSQGIATSATCVSIECWPAWNVAFQPQRISPEPCQTTSTCPAEEMTTVMLRNIPNDYTRAMLLDLLDSLGLCARYDFLYLPIDFHRGSSLGYAFVNFNSHEDAVLGKSCLHGFADWKVSSQKVCEVIWGEPLQGQSAHVERYRSSPVMHNDVPDEFKPIIFKDGVREPFPPPTKRVRPPRSKRASH
mmetsp:Transcript_54910/g.87153  ORF Transcript_54910/g.87153 Transcript_54910/m.87153 type:complete len:378 (+) Transcript_54910:68-1201(+)